MNGLLVFSVALALLLGAHVDEAEGNECYLCASCGAPADFKPTGTGVTKVPCPAGKCFTKQTTAASVDTYARGCDATSKSCDEASVSCCDGNLCNDKSQTLKSGASILTGMTLIGTTFVMVASSIVLN